MLWKCLERGPGSGAGIRGSNAGRGIAETPLDAAEEQARRTGPVVLRLCRVVLALLMCCACFKDQGSSMLRDKGGRERAVSCLTVVEQVKQSLLASPWMLNQSGYGITWGSCS